MSSSKKKHSRTSVQAQVSTKRAFFSTNPRLVGISSTSQCPASKLSAHFTTRNRSVQTRKSGSTAAKNNFEGTRQGEIVSRYSSESGEKAIGDLAKYLRQSLGQNLEECIPCGQVFADPVKFNAHLETKTHKQIIKRTEAEKKRFFCKTCHAIFLGPRALQRHLEGERHRYTLYCIHENQK